MSNERVGRPLDAWREQMAQRLETSPLSAWEQKSQRERLQVLSKLRPCLVQGDEREDFPRTNPDRERSIRALKTPYRRVSGRKNGGKRLYGVLGVVWPLQPGGSRMRLTATTSRTQSLSLIGAAGKSSASRPAVSEPEQLTRFRFRHKRSSVLASLEARWSEAALSASLP